MKGEDKLESDQNKTQTSSNPVTYVYKGSYEKIEMYSIDYSNGQLRPLLTKTIATGGQQTFDLKSTPNHLFLYAAHMLTNTGVSMYSINQSTGELAPLSQLTISTPANDSYVNNIAIHPNGKYAYFCLQVEKKILKYPINQTTGILEENLKTEVAISYQPSSLKI